jgi:hypothetical protein
MGFLYPVGLVLVLIGAILLIVVFIKVFTSTNPTGETPLQISSGVIGGLGMVCVVADFLLVRAENKEEELDYASRVVARKRVSKRSRKSKRAQ